MKNNEKKISIDVKHLKEMMANKKFASALAFSLLVKNKMKNSVVLGWTKKKLCNISGCNDRTVGKHLATLKEYGLVTENVVNGRKDLTFVSLRNKKDSRKEVCIKNFGIRKLTDADYHLYVLCFKLLIASKKEWPRNQLFRSHNFYKKETGVAARKNCKEYGLNRYNGDIYMDFGYSLSSISKNLGVAREKTVKIINLAIEYGVVRKEKRVEWKHIQGVHAASKYLEYELKEAFTYVKNRDFVVKIFANRYYLCDSPLEIAKQMRLNAAETAENMDKTAFTPQNEPENAQKSA